MNDILTSFNYFFYHAKCCVKKFKKCWNCVYLALFIRVRTFTVHFNAWRCQDLAAFFQRKSSHRRHTKTTLCSPDCRIKTIKLSRYKWLNDIITIKETKIRLPYRWHKWLLHVDNPMLTCNGTSILGGHDSQHLISACQLGQGSNIKGYLSVPARLTHWVLSTNKCFGGVDHL